MGVDADEKWFAEVARRLQTLESHGKRISLETLRGVFTEVFAHRPGIPQRRDWLLRALHHAEKKGIVKFPSATGKTTWDHTGIPSLPKYVTKVVTAPPPKDLWWKDYYWHPLLEWVAGLDKLPEEYGDFLKKVHQGFVEHWFDEAAPLNRRSVELTGKEKRLKKLFKTSLFGEGCLDRTLLNVISDVMPLAHEVVGTKPIALVFENKEPFNVALKVLQELSDPPYGILAYGGGGSFEDSVRDFLRIQESQRYRACFQAPLKAIHYVGDLDWTGLKIARGASLKAEKYMLPALTPAIGLHKLMIEALQDLRINYPDGFPDDEIKRARTSDLTLLEWLPSNVRDEARRILELGHRVPEEMLTTAALFRLWNDDLAG